MKKAFAVLPLLVLLSALSGCGGKDKAPFDPAADAQTLLSSGAFSETLTEIDQEILCLQYGIDESTVTGCAAYGSTGATAEELAILTFENQENTDAALTALQFRVEDRIEELRDYLPNEITKLDGAIIQTRGHSVLLVVASDYGPVQTFLGE